MVSTTTWKAANAALAARTKPGRSATVNEKPLLRPTCGACYGHHREGCPNGISVMYRVWAGKKASRRSYYRCSGSGTKRSGCHAPLIRCDYLDTEVIESFLDNDDSHFVREFVAGDSRADEIERLRLKLDTAKSRSESNALWDQIEQLEAEPSIPPHWETRETDQSEAAYFTSLSEAERREYLTQWDVTVYPADPADPESIPSIVTAPKSLRPPLAE